MTEVIPWAAAICRQIDPELWFAESWRDIQKAIAICKTCPIKTMCAEYAEQNGLIGVWGGQHRVWKRPHQESYERWKAADRDKRHEAIRASYAPEVLAIGCTFCGAGPGEYCETPRQKRISRAHNSRLDLLRSQNTLQKLRSSVTM